MALTAQFQTDFSGNRRYAARRHLRLATALGPTNASAMIHDLSVTGMLLETAEEALIDDLLLVEIPNVGHVPATVVWNSGRFFGCKFDQPISVAAVSSALLQNPVSNPNSGRGVADDETSGSPPLNIEEAQSDKLTTETDWQRAASWLAGKMVSRASIGKSHRP